MRRRVVLLLVLPVALAARADDVSSRTRLALHQALELHATEPVASPSLPQTLTQGGVPGLSTAAAAQATQAASKAQNDAANQAAQDVANGRGHGNGNGNGNDANDSSRDAAGQKRGAEAKETGGKGVSGHPDKPGKPPH